MQCEIGPAPMPVFRPPELDAHVKQVGIGAGHAENPAGLQGAMNLREKIENGWVLHVFYGVRGVREADGICFQRQRPQLVQVVFDECVCLVQRIVRARMVDIRPVRMEEIARADVDELVWLQRPVGRIAQCFIDQRGIAVGKHPSDRAARRFRNKSLGNRFKARHRHELRIHRTTIKRAMQALRPSGGRGRGRKSRVYYLWLTPKWSLYQTASLHPWL